MRILGRLILWSFLLVVAWWATINSMSYFNWNQAQHVAWEKDYNSYTTYWLNPSNDLSFDIPANAAQIRIIVVSKQLEAQAAAIESIQANGASIESLPNDIPLTFEFSSRDSAQNFVISHLFSRDDMQQNEMPINQLVIDQDSAAQESLSELTINKNHLNKKLIDNLIQTNEAQNKLAKQELPLRFFDSPNGAKASFGQVAYIDNQNYAKLSIRAADIKSQQISVRVAVLEQKVASDLAIAWQRMHKNRRVELLEEHIFPVDLVSEYEKKEALRYRWLPIGPNGTEEEDYNTARLYVHSNLVPTPTEQQLESKVLQNWSNQNERFTFEHLWQNPYQLACDNQSSPKWLSLRYQSSDLLVNKHWFYQEKQLSQKIDIPPLDGRFEVQTERFCSIILTDGQGNLVEDNSNLLRAYRVDSQQSVTYQLAGQDEKHQPIRVDFRALVEPSDLTAIDLNNESLVSEVKDSKSSTTKNQTQQKYMVDWKIVDANNLALRTGSEILPLFNNRYETLEPSRADYLKAKTSLYLLAPPKADKLIITSQQVALVNAFSRPIDLPFAVNQDNKPYQEVPKWFSIKPQQSEQLINNDRAELIDFRKRLVPPAQEQALQQLIPLKSANSLLTFELFEADQTEQQQSWHYHRISAAVINAQAAKNQPKTIVQTLEFFDNAQRKSVDASLVYRASDIKLAPFKVQVHLDDELFAEFWVSQNTGKISLPSIAVGKHRLKLSGASKDYDWFINRSRPVTKKLDNPQDLYRIRQVYPIKNKATFVFEKQTEAEWLTFLVYPKNNQVSLTSGLDFQALITIEKPRLNKVATSHTVASRKYFIKLSELTQDKLPEANSKDSLSLEKSRNNHTAHSAQLLNQKDGLLNSSIALKFPIESDVKNSTYKVTIELLGLNASSDEQQVNAFIQAYYVKDDVQQKIIYFNESIYD